ncbi:outer membrane beta-barrel protein [Parabacteroides sp. FAFU027]|uniref:outer membrane beta-barrel protein n=1 Tax=Parabacteroides sp. FAFU027 TaxID=2922715 RepID=UPI001FB00041|nr:TonB-dependent receptor family protein [Parabacteroides sp. FAFU027]
MKNIFIMALLCLFAVNAHARQIITGSVVEKESNKPIEAATVELLQVSDSSSVEVVYTNSEGAFTLMKADTAKRYCLRVRQLNFKIRKVSVAKSTNRIINIGQIALDPSSINLKEIVVNGSKIKVTELPDRTVYGIPTDLKKISTDGLDVLRKVPSVQIDYFNEEIKVDGKTNIKIEVDGVTRDKDFIKKLHPTQIDKLEVITSPTGKYDADVDAVINIITIKEMRYGLKGTVNTQLLPNSTDRYMMRGMGSLDYGLKTISYYVSANGGLGKFDFINTMDRYAGPDTLHQNGNMNSFFANGNINAGFIYDPNEKNNLSLNISYNGNNSKTNNDQTNNSWENTNPKSITGTTSESKNKNGGLNASLFYKHSYDKKKSHFYEIETSLYSSLINTNTTNYKSKYYTTLDKTEQNNSRISTLNGRFGYFLPFDSVYTFGTGINANYNHNYINNIRSLTQAPDLEYNNTRGSMFAELSRNFKKGNLKVGTRGEFSYVTINTTNTNKFFSLLPYANGQYKINDRNSIKLNYSRRVIRPSRNQLNPFVSYVDSLTISQGNINLVPAYRDNFQLTYNVKYGKSKFSGNLSPQLFFEYRTRLIQTITQEIQNTGRFEKIPMNISNGYEGGLGLSVNAQIVTIIFNSNFRYFRSHIDNYIDEKGMQQIAAQDRNSWNWNSQIMCPLPLNLRFFSMLNLTGPTVNGQETSKSSPFYLAGIVKQFKNNSSLTILAFNPFAENFFKSTTTLNNSSFYQRSQTFMNMKNAFLINYSYNFKLGKDVKAQKQETEQNIEENNIKLPF